MGFKRKGISVLALLAAMLAVNSGVVGDDNLESFKKQAQADFNAFKNKAQEDFEQFRRRANDDYARFMSERWIKVDVLPEVTPPVVEPAPEPIYENPDTVNRRNLKPVVIKERVTIPTPQPKPVPLEPIRDIVPVAPKPDEHFCVTMYGTKFTFRKPNLNGWRINGRSEADFAKAWKKLNTDATNNLIIDCLAERDDKNLCDWAYFALLQQVGEHLAGDKGNDATLLAGFLLCQSGYKMRFAKNTSGHLALLYSAHGTVYHSRGISLDGDVYYFANKDDLKGDYYGFNPKDYYSICDFSFPKEKKLSLGIDAPMNLEYKPSSPREFTVKFHPELNVKVTVNQNLIDFFNDYPEGTLDGNMYTKWAIYANAPVSEEIERELYPSVRNFIAGKSQVDAANVLLHLAEMFPYGYDSEIWGYDRAFFADESWFYPYSDCEDHAIHFSRLVRDLMGLDAVLVYYPGHLAAAVAFDGEAQGDYVVHRGKKFTICDPTIFYSNVGTTMTGMNNAEAVLIDLKP